MSRLPARDTAMYGEHLCNCGETARYIHANAHWCRTCLDNKQYPHLAHLTQEERDAMRLSHVKGRMTVVNIENIKKAGF